MDFLKLNSEFLNLQKKLEYDERIIKELKQYLKSVEKDIKKLEQKIGVEKDNIQKSINLLILEIMQEFKKSLEDIIDKKED